MFVKFAGGSLKPGSVVFVVTEERTLTANYRIRRKPNLTVYLAGVNSIHLTPNHRNGTPDITLDVYCTYVGPEKLSFMVRNVLPSRCFESESVAELALKHAEELSRLLTESEDAYAKFFPDTESKKLSEDAIATAVWERFSSLNRNGTMKLLDSFGIESEGAGENTVIHYLYRDANNYKLHCEEVVRGKITPLDKWKIIGSLLDGENFIPEMVGLPAPRFETETEDDLPFYELCLESFALTNKPETVDTDIETLVHAFELESFALTNKPETVDTDIETLVHAFENADWEAEN